MSRITKVTAIPLAVPRKREGTQFVPYSGRLQILKAVHGCFVRVETGSGLVGIGECTVREVPEAHAAVIERLLAPVLIGSDPEDIGVAWSRMFHTLRTRGHNSGIFFEALAGVDCALWDMAGKAQKKPVSSLLGGRQRDRLKAYASSILFGEDAGSLTKRLVQIGHDWIKLKVGLGVEKDVKNVKAMREIVGDRVEIVVDANSAYGTNDAIRLGRHLERLQVRWFEEPVAPDNIDGYVHVARVLDVPIAAGESHFSKYTFLDLMRRHAVDIIQPNVGRSGGITETRKILGMAEAFNVQYAPHTGLSGIGCRAASIQLASTVPEDLFLAYEYGIFPHPFGNYILRSPVEGFTSGYVEVPDRPGLGLDLDAEVVDMFQRPGRKLVWDDTKIIEDTKGPGGIGGRRHKG